MTVPDGLFKILGADRVPCHGGVGRWPVPGVWREVEGPIVPCRNGLHLCRARHLLLWAREGATVWRVEADGDVLDGSSKVVASRARLVEPVGVLTARVLRLTAADIAESVAHLHDHNPACMEAIRVGRLRAHGLASDAMMEAARDAAWADAWAAASAAASVAAWAADLATVPWHTAWDAARYVAQDANGALLLDNLTRYGGA